MKCTDEVENIIKSDQIDFFGIGDLEAYSKELIEYGYPIIENYSRSISIGLTLLHSFVDNLSVDASISDIELYRHFCYDMINQKIDAVLLKIYKTLTTHGYKTLPISASITTDKARLFGSFSHKAAAFIAGIGWIGKSCLLITEKVGPRVRWGTVLTNAPLMPTGSPMKKNCGKCRICVQECPAGAFTGINFKMSEERGVRYNAFKCDEYLSERKNATGFRVCGICLQVCPYGRKNSKN